MRKQVGLGLILGLTAGFVATLAICTSVVRAAPLPAITETRTSVPSATRKPAPSATATRPAPSPTSAPTATPTQGSHPKPGPTVTSSPIIVDPLIAKVANVDQARVGDAIQFTIYVTNPNPVEIANVVVTDLLPPQVDFIAATTTQGSVAFDGGSHTLTANLGTMAPGLVVTIQITVRVNASAAPPETLRNLATVCFDDNRCADSNAVTVTMIPNNLPTTGNGPGPEEIQVMVLAGLALMLGVGAGVWVVRRWNRPHA